MKRAAENDGNNGNGAKKSNSAWGGGFTKAATPVLQRFSESISYDKKLYKQDIRGSQAHAKMLATVKLITEEDYHKINDGLEKILKEIEAGTFVFRTDREDIHMNIEARLIDDIGEAAKKLHTARSRNDQCQTDLRLWVREEIDALCSYVVNLQVSLVRQAKANENLIIPGYTHLQRAQPVLLAHHMLAYVEELQRDVGRLRDCQKRMNYCPLGAGALAGTGLPIDRYQTSKELGFTAPLANSMDAVGDRDYVIELLSSLSIISLHLSRLAEEWVLWTTEEFQFIKMDDSVSTGSSMMPQKKNPDPMELARGKSARVVGSLVTLLVLCKGLPMTYNRDLQEDKEPLFDAVQTVKDVLEMTAEFADKITFNADAIGKRIDHGFLDATTLADYLVNKGLPFRSAHHVVGSLVKMCTDRKLAQLRDLSVAEMKTVHGGEIIGEDVKDWLGATNAVSRFQSYGSTGKAQVSIQLSQWLTTLGLDNNNNNNNK